MLNEGTSLAGVCEALGINEADAVRLDKFDMEFIAEKSWLRAFEEAMSAILKIRQAVEELSSPGSMPSVQDIVNAHGTAPRHQADAIIAAIRAMK